MHTPMHTTAATRWALACLTLVAALLSSIPTTGAAPGDRVLVTDDRHAHIVGPVDDSTVILVIGDDIVAASVATGEITPILTDVRKLGLVDISPDGTRLVYSRHSGSGRGLYSLRLPAGAPTKISGPFGPGGTVLQFVISPDSSSVVYLADAEMNRTDELYSVPIDGGEVVKLNRRLVPNEPGSRSGGDVKEWFQVTPDSERVVYVADARTNNVRELFSTRIDGTDHTRLSDRMPAGGDVMPIFRLSPDGDKVLYVADQDTNNVRELYVVAADGRSSPVKVNGPFGPGGDIIKLDHPGAESDPAHHRLHYRFTPNGSRVVYSADARVNGREEVFSVNPDGSDLVRLSRTPPRGGEVQFFGVSDDSRRVVIAGDLRTNGQRELYSTPVDRRRTRVLNPELPRWGDVNSYWDLRANVVTFSADVEVDGDRIAYTVPADGSGPAIRVGGDAETEGAVTGQYAVQLTPDASHVIFQTRRPDGRASLWAVPVDGGDIALLRTGRSDTRRAVIMPDSGTILAKSASEQLLWAIELPRAG